MRLVASLACVAVVTVAWRETTPIEAQGPRQQLEIDGAFELHMASNKDITLLVTLSARSDLAMFRSADEGPFVSTAFVVSPDHLERRVWGLWATTHGFFVVQRTRGYLPRISRSIDGAIWVPIESGAFDTPADIHGMVQLANGDLLAVGALRLGRTPATPETFRAAMWRSSDGVVWQRVALDGSLAGASSFGSVATAGNAIIVAGQRAGYVVWRSDDGGTSWFVAGSARQGERIAAIGGQFVRFDVSPPGPLEIAFSTSLDGREWRDGTASNLLDEGLWLSHRDVATTTSGVFLVGFSELDVRRRLDWCYVELAACARGGGSAVVLHTKGDTWKAIDIESLLGPQLQAVAISETDASTIFAGAVGRTRVEIIRVPRGSWRERAPRSVPSLPPLPPLAPGDRMIEPATVYRYPKNVHCGLTWLGSFNGQTWKLTRQFVGTRDTVRSWPQVRETLLGTIRLTTPDTIEYALEGLGVVAVYGPTNEAPPMCA
jgi:hypothetical protein